jgi:glycosyltransferase involved in cell wall biosynthesis
VTFAGYLTGEQLLGALSAFDIGIIPDPYNEYNDKISMNKVFEYSTLGIPIVSYDLSETRRLLGDAGTYAKTADPAGLADAVAVLAKDPALLASRGQDAKQRATAKFEWEREAAKYVACFDRLKPRLARR